MLIKLAYALLVSPAFYIRNQCYKHQVFVRFATAIHSQAVNIYDALHHWHHFDCQSCGEPVKAATHSACHKYKECPKCTEHHVFNDFDNDF